MRRRKTDSNVRGLGNILVGQSGGPTAAINATLSGVIRAAMAAEKRGSVGTVYGMRNGMEGCLKGDLVDLSERIRSARVPDTELKQLQITPAAALGSCRYRMPDPATDSEPYEKFLEVCRRYRIGCFFYIGGNDSMDTAAKIGEYVKSVGYEMTVIGVPKTIDNDLVGVEHTPGYGSAAKYIATTMQEIMLDTAVYTTPSVTIVEIMGRDAGWLTASAALAGLGGSAPDVICLPERVFDPEKFLDKIAKAWKTHSNITVAVSEGIRFENGEYVGAGAQSGAVDVFGHKYLAGAGKVLEALCRDRLKCKVRSVELNLPQRCAGHISSAYDIRESSATGFGAVTLALKGKSGVMVSLSRTAERDRIVLGSVPLTDVAGKIRTVPDAYISEDGFGVTDAFIAYASPLIVGEPNLVYRNGLPAYFKL